MPLAAGLLTSVPAVDFKVNSGYGHGSSPENCFDPHSATLWGKFYLPRELAGDKLVQAPVGMPVTQL